MATFNDLKTIIANIDEALGEGHIIKYFPERYSSTPTKTFASKDLAVAYGKTMLDKYKTVQEALVKAAAEIKAKVEKIKTTNNWQNITVVDLSPNPCSISFGEVIYGIAGAKSTKNVINTTTEVTNTTTQAKTTTSTLKSTDWETSGYYDLVNNAKEADTVTLGTSNITTDTTAGTSTDTHDDTTATVTHYRHPLVVTNRLLDGVIYDTVLVLLYYFYKMTSVAACTHLFILITPVVSGTATDGILGSFSNYGRRMPDQSSDNYSIDEDTHKLSGLGTSGTTSWAGSTENTDVLQGYNKPYAHVWWVDKDTNKVTYYGNKGEVTYRHFTATSSSGEPADLTTQDGTITGKNDGGAIDHNLEFLEIDKYYSKIKEAQTPRNADVNTTVPMKTRYTKNTKPSWTSQLTTIGTTANNTDANGNEQTATIATYNVSTITNDADKDVIVTTNYKTGELDSHFSMGSWAYGTYNSSTGLAMSCSDYTTSSSLDSHLSAQLSSWLNYYNMFTRAAMFKQTDHAILFLHDNVLPIIPKKYIDLNAQSCANHSHNNGKVTEAYDSTEYTVDSRKVRLAGDQLLKFKYTTVPNLNKSTTAKATVTKFPISSQFDDVTVGSSKTYIQLYYTVTAIRRAWKYYTGMTLTDNQIKRIENETPTAAQTNIYTVNSTALSQIPLGWFDDWGEYGQDMHKVDSASTSDAKYLETTDYKFNKSGLYGKLDLLYQDERVDAWASGTDIYAAGTTELAAGTAANKYHTRALIVIVIAPTYISYRLCGPSTALSNVENSGYCYSYLTINKEQDTTDNQTAITSAYLNAKGAWDYLKSIDTDGTLLAWCKANNCELITEPYGATLVVNDLYNRKNDTSIDLWALYTLVFNKDLMCFKSELLNGDIAVTTNDY